MYKQTRQHEVSSGHMGRHKRLVEMQEGYSRGYVGVNGGMKPQNKGRMEQCTTSTKWPSRLDGSGNQETRVSQSSGPNSRSKQVRVDAPVPHRVLVSRSPARTGPWHVMTGLGVTCPPRPRGTKRHPALLLLWISGPSPRTPLLAQQAIGLRDRGLLMF